jgi:hypothetical protein
MHDDTITIEVRATMISCYYVSQLFCAVHLENHRNRATLTTAKPYEQGNINNSKSNLEAGCVQKHVMLGKDVINGNGLLNITC